MVVKSQHLRMTVIQQFTWSNEKKLYSFISKFLLTSQDQFLTNNAWSPPDRVMKSHTTWFAYISSFMEHRKVHLLQSLHLQLAWAHCSFLPLCHRADKENKSLTPLNASFWYTPDSHKSLMCWCVRIACHLSHSVILMLLSAVRQDDRCFSYFNSFPE